MKWLSGPKLFQSCWGCGNSRSAVKLSQKNGSFQVFVKIYFIFLCVCVYVYEYSHTYVGACYGFSESSPSLSQPFFQVGGAVWEGSGDMVLSEEVCHWRPLRECKHICHFKFTFCFMPGVQDVSPQLPVPATVPLVHHHRL